MTGTFISRVYVADLLDSICRLNPNLTSSLNCSCFSFSNDSLSKQSFRVTGNFRMFELPTILYMNGRSAISVRTSKRSSFALFSSALPVMRLPPPAGSIASFKSMVILPLGSSISAFRVYALAILSTL